MFGRLITGFTTVHYVTFQMFQTTLGAPDKYPSNIPVIHLRCLLLYIFLSYVRLNAYIFIMAAQENYYGPYIAKSKDAYTTTSGQVYNMTFVFENVQYHFIYVILLYVVFSYYVLIDCTLDHSHQHPRTSCV